MRVLTVSVLTISLVLSSLNAVCEERQDEINFNQAPIVTVDINPSNDNGSSNGYINFLYVAAGMLSVYALATWKVSQVRRFNQVLLSVFNWSPGQLKSTL